MSYLKVIWTGLLECNSTLIVILFLISYFAIFQGQFFHFYQVTVVFLNVHVKTLCVYADNFFSS